MTDALGAAAASWGVLMALSPTLQIRRMLERRSSADVSIAYLAVLELGFLLWMAYGVALGNVALIVPNSVAFVIGAATIGIAVRYRDPDRGAEPVEERTVRPGGAGRAAPAGRPRRSNRDRRG